MTARLPALLVEELTVPNPRAVWIATAGRVCSLPDRPCLAINVESLGAGARIAGSVTAAPTDLTNMAMPR